MENILLVVKIRIFLEFPPWFVAHVRRGRDKGMVC